MFLHCFRDTRSLRFALMLSQGVCVSSSSSFVFCCCWSLGTITPKGPVFPPAPPNSCALVTLLTTALLELLFLRAWCSSSLYILFSQVRQCSLKCGELVTDAQTDQLSSQMGLLSTGHLHYRSSSSLMLELPMPNALLVSLG